MKRLLAMLGLLISSFTASGVDMSHGADNFFKSDQVTVQKVSFENHYQPNAGHVDLYDRVDLIPFARLTQFFQVHLT